MKKTLVFMLLLAAITANAQTAHLSFKGVPIDGPLSTFVGKLKQKGLKLIETDNGTSILNGNFASFKDCTIAASSYDNGDVNKVVVIFPSKETWSDLYHNYASLKSMLTEKYGNPESVEETFQGYSQPNDDDDRMYKVKFDNCRYISDFVTDGGIIELRIEHNSVLECFVILIYEDATNSEKIRASAIEDL